MQLLSLRKFQLFDCYFRVVERILRNVSGKKGKNICMGRVFSSGDTIYKYPWVYIEECKKYNVGSCSTSIFITSINAFSPSGCKFGPSLLFSFYLRLGWGCIGEPRSCKRSKTLFKSLLFWLAGEVSWLAVALSMLKIKVRISETKFLSFYKTLWGTRLRAQISAPHQTNKISKAEQKEQKTKSIPLL